MAPKGYRTGPNFYGRRKGKKLNAARQELMDQRLPELRVPEIEGDGIIDPASLFPSAVSACWLEVGFGGGEHLAGQAQANPTIGIIGCEVFINGVSSLVRHVDEMDLTNVRIWPEDARELLPHFPDQSFERIFVLYPDPWRKTRHANRRFIGPDNLPTLSRLLIDGGELRVVTDDPTYQDWTLEHAPDYPDFDWTNNTPEDYLTAPADWVQTRYEVKALKEGRTPMYFRFIRKSR